MDDLDRLAVTIDGFCQFIADLPEEALIPQSWGPREVLAHLVFHHEAYVAQVEAQLAGKPYRLPTGRFADINAQAVAENQDQAVNILIQRLQAANQSLTALYRQQDPQSIIIHVKQGSKAWPLTDLVPAIEAHIRNHQKKLCAAKKEASFTSGTS